MHRCATLQTLDSLIQARSILRHPFYEAWREGCLSRPQLAIYARVYWPHVAAFPGYLEMVIARSDDPVVRSELERNLEDERGRPRPHPEMWLDFAEAVGATRATIVAARPHACAEALVETVTNSARASVAEGVAALYAYEAQQPAVSREKLNGLRRHYGVESESGLEYFTVHAEADIAHSRGERDVLARCLDGSSTEKRVVDAAIATLDAYWGLLDGIADATAATVPRGVSH